MRDEEKTKEQLVNELEVLRRLVAELEEDNANINLADKERERLLADDERRSVEAARIAAVNEKNLLQAVMEALPAGVAILDVHGGAVQSNSMFETVWGTPRPLPRGVDEYAEYKAWWPETGKPVQPKEWASARAVEKGETVLGQLVEIETFDGKHRFIINSAAPFRGADGRIAGSVVALLDITELKKAQDALRNSEASFRLLSETAAQLLGAENPQAIVDELCRKVMEHLDCHAFFNFVVDEGAGRLHLNACAGIPEEEMRKIEWLDYGVAVCGCVARDRERLVAHDIFETPDSRTELVKSYGIQAYACHPLTAQGRLIGTLSFGTKTRARFTSQELALMKTVSDQVAVAMERMNLVERLQRSRDELEMRVRERTKELVKANEETSDLYNNAPCGYHSVGPDGTVLRMNDTELHWLGYTRDEIIGRKWSDLLTPSSLLKFRHCFPVLKRQGWIKDLEYELIRKDGTVLPVLLNATAVMDAEGAYVASRSSIFDITERKRVVDALSESEIKYKTLSQEFTTLLQAIEDSLVLLSPELKVLWANQGAAYGVELPSMESIGQCCYRMIEGRDEPCEDCGVLQCFLTGEQQAWMSVRGGRYLDKRAFPLFEDGKVWSVILLVRDITEKMTLQAEAMQASHLASLGELAASVAHEINNPINGIINYAQILANKAEANSTQLDISRRIIKEGDRIANIVRSLLSFARDDHKSKGPSSFREILNDTLTLVHAPMRKEGIYLTLEMADSLPPVLINPQQIQQVLLNVINNARYALNQKYPGTHDDKALKIGGEHISREGRDFLRLSFLDCGTGIKADILDRVMEPFFSTKPSKQGTGLGLSVSNRIINDHGGRFEIESVAGEYTKVILELPVWEER